MATAPRVTQSRTVLIVDDDEDCRIIFSLALQHAGYRASTAVNGADGVAIARRDRPSVILMDIAMPVKHGVAALEEIRSDQNLRSVPIIAVTAAAANDDAPALLARGFDQVVFKPLTPADLVGVVAQYGAH